MFVFRKNICLFFEPKCLLSKYVNILTAFVTLSETRKIKVSNCTMKNYLGTWQAWFSYTCTYVSQVCAILPCQINRNHISVNMGSVTRFIIKTRRAMVELKLKLSRALISRISPRLLQFNYKLNWQIQTKNRPKKGLKTTMSLK